MVIDSTNRIVVTGSGNFGGGEYKMYVGRYNADGSLDSGFGTNGFFIESTGSIGRDVAIDSGGRIVAAGRRSNGSNNDVAVWRFNQDGSPDTTFDGDGNAVYDISGEEDDAGKMAIDSAGRIMVTGRSYNGSNYDMAVWRFNPDGSLDTAGFHPPDGYIIHNNAANGNGDDVGSAVVLDKSGKIVITGRSKNSSLNSDMIIWRYNPDGSPDTGFDGDGVAVWNNVANDEGLGLAIDAAGRILVTGYSVVPGDLKDMIIMRYTSTGSPDASFGINGVVFYDYKGKDDAGFSILTNTDGHILVSGFVSDSNTDTGLWMYDGNGSPVSSFGLNGLFRMDLAGGNDQSVSVLLDAPGRIVTAGEFINEADRDIAIWRFVAK